MSVNTLNDDKNILTVYMIVLHTEPLSISAFEMGRLTKDPACSLGKIEFTPEARYPSLALEVLMSSAGE